MQHPETERVIEILDAACRVIARDGWNGLRMERVAREAVVSKALVHYYFSTRRELMRAAFHHSEDRAESRVQAILFSAGTGAERLERYLLSNLDDDPAFSENRALWTEIWSGMREDPALIPDVEQRYRDWLRHIEALVEEGRGDGSIPASADPKRIALQLGALMDGIESLLLLDLVDLEQACDLVRTTIAGGLEPANNSGEERV